MSIDYRVISIGALAQHRLRGETQNCRPSHATTTLLRDGDRMVLVDPALPAEVLAQRLEERVGLTPDKIECVFLTCFRPAHRRSLGMFTKATWLAHQDEIEATAAHLEELRAHAEDKTDSDPEVLQVLEDEQRILRQVRPAEEKLTSGIHLFPAQGATPGTCGLLLAAPSRTTVIAGDAVLTQEHFEHGTVFQQSVDVERAQSSFADIMEIADEIVPGHDNVFCPQGR